MKNLYEVQQLLKKYNIYVHLGKRIWDIELMALELDRLFKSGLVSQKDYMSAKVVLRHEHDIEENKEKKNG